MRIKTIGYGELVTGIGFNNKRLYAEAELSITDDPNKVYMVLKEMVKKTINEDEPYFNEKELPF